MIKNLLLSSALALAALATPVASQAADVGVSISIGDPNFYGRIDIGDTRPEVVYAQPVIIQRVHTPPPPVYLRVPPGHERNWSKHCGRYGACGRPVYFVRDVWYRDVYAPKYRRDHPRPGHHHDHRGPGRHDHRDHDRHDRHDHHDKRGPHDRDDRGDRGDRGDHGRGR